MEDAAFSDAFCEFIRDAIPAVDAAELLLVLARRAGEWLRSEEAFSRLDSASAMTIGEGHRYVERFRAMRLIARGPDKRIRYQPATAELAEHVQTLWRAYEERPVTLFRLIYALRDTRIRSFADAFTLRS